MKQSTLELVPDSPYIYNGVLLSELYSSYGLGGEREGQSVTPLILFTNIRN